jgi:hypothetical protein
MMKRVQDAQNNNREGIDRSLVDVSCLQAGLADAVASIDVQERKVEAMLFCDDGCRPMSAVSDWLADELVKRGAASKNKAKNVRTIMLAVEDGDKQFTSDEVLVIDRLTIPLKDGKRTIKKMEFAIIPGYGPELIIGQSHLEEWGAITTSRQLFDRSDTIERAVSERRRQRGILRRVQ